MTDVGGIKANFPHDPKPDIEVQVNTTAGPFGYVCVRIREEWSDDNYASGMGHFTPKRARKLALAILAAADIAEAESAK